MRRQNQAIIALQTASQERSLGGEMPTLKLPLIFKFCLVIFHFAF